MILIFFITGLIIGSFLNVVVYRLNLMETIMGRSYCPQCKAQVRWYDNIPLISFVLLKARCRDCKEMISWQYPFIELFTGLAFAGVGVWFFNVSNIETWMQASFLLVIFSFLTVILAYDLKFMEIPMLIFWIATGITVLFLIALDWNNFSSISHAVDSRLISGIIAGTVAGGFFLAMVLVSKETWMGWGDVYLGFLAGLIVGWPNILLALMLSFTIGAVVSIILMTLKKKDMKSQVPFAPFLVFGIILTIFIYEAYPKIEQYLYF